MKTEIDAPEMLNREFLEIRSRLIDIAAALDRIDRRPQSAAARRDARYARIEEAIALLASAAGSNRAERVQMLFSDPYEGPESVAQPPARCSR